MPLDQLDHGTVVKTTPAANRREFPAIMVMEATAIGMIGVIRSLGRSGYPVHACSSNANALGFSSNFAAARAVHPDYDDPAFLNWLRDYSREHQIAVIVPSEGFLHAIRPAFDEFAPLVPVSADPSVVYRALSKSETFEALLSAPKDSGLGANNPPSLFVDEGAALEGPEPLRALGLPMFIKVDSGHGRRGQDNQVVKADTIEEAFDAVTSLLGDYTKVLIQGYVPGTKVAADFCIHNGEVIVESMWEASHENPHRGGMASLRRVCWHQDIHDDALRKLRHLRWEGVAMMEYRRDLDTGKFYFIELSARFRGGLHAELYAGIDFPYVQIGRILNKPATTGNYRGKHVLCRHTVPGEFGYVLSRVRDPEVSRIAKLWTTIEFFLLFLDPRVKSDLTFPGDRKLNYMEWMRFLTGLVGALYDRVRKAPKKGTVRLEFRSVAKNAVRACVLYAAKFMGLFDLSRSLTRQGLRILCYHGGSLLDEHRFSPGTFMTEDTFQRRMDFIVRHKYPVLGLTEAMTRMDEGTLPDCATVITIDDGWLGTYEKLVPVLKRRRFPATLYVTTYYAVKETAVFEMFVPYLFWRSTDKSIDLARVADRLVGSFDLGDAAARDAAVDLILAYANAELDAAGRQMLANRISDELGCDTEGMSSAGLFRLVDQRQISELATNGIDIQLHTHRHRLPAGRREDMEREIRDNAAVLEPIAGSAREHFCYPSGKYDLSQIPWLEQLGVRTATTVAPGFSYRDTPKMLLPRILDSEAVSDIEFEAELSGFIELTRRLRSRLGDRKKK